MTSQPPAAFYASNYCCPKTYAEPSQLFPLTLAHRAPATIVLPLMDTPSPNPSPFCPSLAVNAALGCEAFFQPLLCSRRQTGQTVAVLVRRGGIERQGKEKQTN